MAIIFTQDEMVKNSVFGDLQESIELLMTKTAEPFEKNSLLRNYFLVRSTETWEKSFRTTGRTMGEFKLADELTETPIDDIGDGFAKSFGVVEWKNGFAVTQNAIEDHRIDDINGLATSLVRGYHRGREYFARDMYAGGLSGVFTYHRSKGSDKLFDCTTIDTIDGGLSTVYHVPLFSVAHRIPENNLKIGGKSVVQSNKFGVIGGIDPTELLAEEKIRDLLGQIRAKGKAFVGMDGKTAGYTYDTIIVPTHYRLADAIRRATKDDNTWKVIEDEYLDDNVGFAKDDLAFLVFSSSALTETTGALWLDRVPLSVKSYVVDGSGLNRWDGRSRYGAGFNLYYHAAYVSLKALVLATAPATISGQPLADVATIVDRDGTVLKGNVIAALSAGETELNNCFYGLNVVAHARGVEVANATSNPVPTQAIA